MGLDIYFSKMKRNNIDSDCCEEESELAYYRKVNFLVAFFENNYNFERDHANYFTLNEDMIKDLIRRCELVFKDYNLAESILPTTAGFFFGSTDYDDYYYDNIVNVLLDMKNIILPEFKNLKEDESIDFYISW